MPVPLAIGLVWWLGFSGLGLIFPFYALYLRENAGLAGSELGLVLAVQPLVGMFGQLLWGQISDRTGQRARVLTAIALGSCVGHLVLLQAGSFAGFLAGTGVLALFSTSFTPSCFAVTAAVMPDGAGFGRARAMGTISFGVSALALPFALRWIQVAGLGAPPARAEGEPGLELIFAAAAMFYVLTALASGLLPRDGDVSARAASGQWRELLRSRDFLRVVGFTLLAFLAMQGPTIMLPVLVRDHGGGIDAISRLWLLMVSLEIPLVYYFGATVRRLGGRTVITLGLLAGVVRWGISGFADDPAWVYGSQVLHGVTVWGVIVGTSFYVNQVVPPELRSTAQAALATFGTGLGALLSNVGAGVLIDVVGARGPARAAAVITALLAVMIPLLVPRPRADAPLPA